MGVVAKATGVGDFAERWTCGQQRPAVQKVRGVIHDRGGCSLGHGGSPDPARRRPGVVSNHAWFWPLSRELSAGRRRLANQQARAVTVETRFRLRSTPPRRFGYRQRGLVLWRQRRLPEGSCRLLDRWIR